MRYVLALCALICCGSLSAGAQVLPTSRGSCSVSPSGVMGCEWLSAASMHKADGTTTKAIPQKSRPQLYVTQFNLAPGAPLTKTIEGYNLLIFGLGDGELVNETKSPPVHINVSNGSVFLIPKVENYVLRNSGKQELAVLEVHTR